MVRYLLCHHTATEFPILMIICAAYDKWFSELYALQRFSIPRYGSPFPRSLEVKLLDPYIVTYGQTSVLYTA